MEYKLELRQMFDESFKRKVIEEYLSTGCTKKELLRKYNIRFKSAIQTWMNKLGYTDIHRSQRAKFTFINKIPLPNNNRDTPNESDLQKRINELERLLVDEKLRSEAYARIIVKAEEELNIPIRKKLNTK
jgi:transposase